MGWESESLFMGFGSNDQDICHAHVWYKEKKTFEDLLLGN